MIQTPAAASTGAARSPLVDGAALLAFLLALVVPPLWAYPRTPSPTQLNQLWAVAGWGGCLALAWGRRVDRRLWRDMAPLTLSFALVALAILGSWVLGHLPTSLALPPLLCVGVAAVLALHGATSATDAPTPDEAAAGARQPFEPFAWGLAVAGVLSGVVAVVQVHFAEWLDPDSATYFVARSGLVGRAVGNLRQPNHLASVLMWGLIALLPLAEWRPRWRWVFGPAALLMVYGVLLSASRTGWVGLGVLFGWGLVETWQAAADHRRPRAWPLLGAGVLAAAAGGLMVAKGMAPTGWLVVAGGIAAAIAWGLFESTRTAQDRRAHGGARGRRLAISQCVALLLVPLVAGAMWWGLESWAASTHHVFGAQVRLGEHDVSSSRIGIWGNTLAMIGQQRWLGTGWGEFNFAWTLTPFPGRPTAFFDHTHSLPLQLLVELGLPLGGLVIAALLTAAVLALLRAWSIEGPAAIGARAAAMATGMILVHSLLEYPLWYTYFLFPAAWAWGYALGAARAHPVVATAAPAQARPSTRDRWSAPVGVAMLGFALLAAVDYYRVSSIYEPGEGEERPLEARIAAGQHSLLFAHHADYADATSIEPPSNAHGAFDRATHSLLDTRLMIAWSKSLAAGGDLERARWLAARLQEFGKEQSEGFFDACADATVQPPPFQCLPPTKTFTWRDFER